MFEFVNRSKGREVNVVVVVICASCAGYGVCKLFLTKLFLSKRIFGELIVFRHFNMDLQYFLVLS